MKKILTCILAMLGLGSACGQHQYEDVDVEQFATLIADTDVVVLDVRTAAEYEEGHIGRAILIDVKQSDLNAEQRRHIGVHLRFVPGSKIKGKKILLVDDVFTTGSTMRACLGILRKHKAGKIVILAVAKVVDRH